jgi:ABC-2 type transport system ATP-binding protein
MKLEDGLTMAAIEIKNLTKSYGKARGILDVNLTVEEGEFFGFIGPNGAGKSTTIRTLLGMIHVTSGEGKVLGYDIQKESTKLLSEIGYLPSEAVFYSGMKVKDVLKLSADLHKKDCKAESARLCERLQLDVNRKVEELSFGNRKKVAIVCALQHEPRLLILDEPTSGLDPLMQKEFFDILKERNEKGTTIFLSSHILSEVQNHCKRAAIIREGRLIACDSVEALAKTNAKRVTIVGDVSLVGLEGVKDERKETDTTQFLYSGDINVLVKHISNMKIKDLSITEPDLEEIFMHYYEEEGKWHDITQA